MTMFSSAVWFVESSLLGNYYQVLREVVADPLPKHLLFGLWSSPVHMFKSLIKVLTGWSSSDVCSGEQEETS